MRHDKPIMARHDKLIFEHEACDLFNNPDIVVLPESYISKEDGCSHLVVADLNNRNGGILFQVVVIPNREYHCMVG